MKQKRPKTEEIIRILREADSDKGGAVLAAEGVSVPGTSAVLLGGLVDEKHPCIAVVPWFTISLQFPFSRPRYDRKRSSQKGKITDILTMGLSMSLLLR
jgi:hypothetical protein